MAKTTSRAPIRTYVPSGEVATLSHPVAGMNASPRLKASAKPRVVELFAGVGGLALDSARVSRWS